MSTFAIPTWVAIPAAVATLALGGIALSHDTRNDQHKADTVGCSKANEHSNACGDKNPKGGPPEGSTLADARAALAAAPGALHDHLADASEKVGAVHDNLKQIKSEAVQSATEKVAALRSRLDG